MHDAYYQRHARSIRHGKYHRKHVIIPRTSECEYGNSCNKRLAKREDDPCVDTQERASVDLGSLINFPWNGRNKAPCNKEIGNVHAKDTYYNNAPQ